MEVDSWNEGTSDSFFVVGQILKVFKGNGPTDGSVDVAIDM